jgi:hypothetical protein
VKLAPVPFDAGKTRLTRRFEPRVREAQCWFVIY